MTAAAKGKTILLVHAGSESKRFILQRLKKMGLKVVCLNRERIAAADQYIDHWITADLNNEQESVVL
jgi:NAD(P)-dependent dehydrogenase (short-subunit alcohol dehydrogenase family)